MGKIIRDLSYFTKGKPAWVFTFKPLALPSQPRSQPHLSPLCSPRKVPMLFPLRSLWNQRLNFTTHLTHPNSSIPQHAFSLQISHPFSRVPFQVPNGSSHFCSHHCSHPLRPPSSATVFPGTGCNMYLLRLFQSHLVGDVWVSSHVPRV